MTTPRTLILLDVDGVLVHPVGYKAALRDTVDDFAAQMGLPAVGLSYDEIAVFEACGLTNEWDSGAICASTLLLAGLARRPDLRPALRPATLADTLAALREARLDIPRPDFGAVARAVAAELARRDSGKHHIPAGVYLSALADQTDPVVLPLLAELMGDVYAIYTPTTRAFQARSLGNVLFAQTYGLPAPFECESYLIQHDRPLLDDSARARLLAWHGSNGHGAAVYTARPSLPPADLSHESVQGFSPEGDLAVRLLNLDGAIPLIGQGRVNWLASQRGRGPAEYVKPSPVQALAAIGAAASRTERAALEAAAALYEDGALVGPLAELAGQPVRVMVFEDAAGGIRSARRAVDLLGDAGLDVSFEGVGVSPQADKRAALSAVADRVVDDVNEGLEPVFSG